jgi:DNA polymerase
MQLIDFASKQVRYAELVRQRKAQKDCGGMTNPYWVENGIYDSEHINPWANALGGDLDASLMIVGQDWGGVEYFIENKGIDKGMVPGTDKKIEATNKTLFELLDSIGIHLEPASRPATKHKLFFTNACLWLRDGRLTTGTIPAAGFRTSAPFLREQIKIVSPKVVVTLGYKAYAALLESYELLPKQTMKEAQDDVRKLPNGSLLIPLYHCGQKVIGIKNSLVRGIRG